MNRTTGAKESLFERGRDLLNRGVKAVRRRVTDQVEQVRAREESIKATLSERFGSYSTKVIEESTGRTLLDMNSDQFQEGILSAFDVSTDKTTTQLYGIAKKIHEITHPDASKLMTTSQQTNSETVRTVESRLLEAVATHLLVQASTAFDEAQPSFRLGHEIVRGVGGKMVKSLAELGVGRYGGQLSQRGVPMDLINRLGEISHDATKEAVGKMVLDNDGQWKTVRDTYGIAIKHMAPYLSGINLPDELVLSGGFRRRRIEFTTDHIQILAMALYALQSQDEFRAYDRARAFYSQLASDLGRQQQLPGGSIQILPSPR